MPTLITQTQNIGHRHTHTHMLKCKIHTQKNLSWLCHTYNVNLYPFMLNWHLTEVKLHKKPFILFWHSGTKAIFFFSNSFIFLQESRLFRIKIQYINNIQCLWKYIYKNKYQPIRNKNKVRKSESKITFLINKMLLHNSIVHCQNNFTQILQLIRKQLNTTQIQHLSMSQQNEAHICKV